MTPEERAAGCMAYVNAVGWEDGTFGGPEHDACQRLRSLIADAIREAEADVNDRWQRATGMTLKESEREEDHETALDVGVESGTIQGMGKP